MASESCRLTRFDDEFAHRSEDFDSCQIAASLSEDRVSHVTGVDGVCVCRINRETVSQTTGRVRPRVGRWDQNAVASPLQLGEEEQDSF